MRPLIVLSARAVAAASLVVLGLGAAAGGVRLLPWLFAPEVPLGLALPFGRLLLAHALDAALVVGLPVGLVAAAATLVERGEARALSALGASPRDLLLPAVLVSAAACALHVTVTSALASQGAGRFSSDLIEEGRSACADAGRSRRVEIPLGGVTWLCFERAPRLVGRVPGLASEAWFSANALRPADDLREIHIQGLSLAMRWGGSRSASLHAKDARLVGLPAWGDRNGARGPLGALRLSLAASALSLVASARVLGRRQGQASPVGAAVAAALGAVVLLSLLRQLEGRLGPLGSFAAAAAAASAVFVVAFALIPGRRSPAVARTVSR